MSEALEIIARVLQIYSFIILARVLMSWVPILTGRPLDPYHPLVKFLLDVTEPVMAPIRRYTTIGMIDLSPIILLFGLNIIAEALIRAA